MPEQPPDTPKLMIDEDWKARVEAEKRAASGEPGQTPNEDLVAAEATPADTAAEGASPDDPELPPASFGMLLSSLATEALVSLGAIPHPATGRLMPRRNQAKYLIDTLAVLREKTTGNLTPDESAALEDTLHQLRMAYVAGR